MRWFMIVAAALFLSGCATMHREATIADAQVFLDHHRVFDTHNDLVGAWYFPGKLETPEALDLASLPGQNDLAKWKAGRFGGGLFTNVSLKGEPEFPRMKASFAWFDSLPARYPEVVKVETATELERVLATDRIAMVMSIEGAMQLDNDKANIAAAKAAGVRSIQLVYDWNTELGDGNEAWPGTEKKSVPANGGLSDKGRAFVAELNCQGVIVDLAHAADSTVRDSIKTSRAPILLSHTPARGIADSAYNVTDDALREAKGNGAIIGVLFAPGTISQAHLTWWKASESEWNKVKAVSASNEEAWKAIAPWDKANPEPAVTVKDVADNIDYIAGFIGRDHVAIGSDFDGMSGTRTKGLEDASTFPVLFAELMRRGWSDHELAGLANGNFIRFWHQVEDKAAELRASGQCPV